MPEINLISVLEFHSSLFFFVRRYDVCMHVLRIVLQISLSLAPFLLLLLLFSCSFLFFVIAYHFCAHKHTTLAYRIIDREHLTQANERLPYVILFLRRRRFCFGKQRTSFLLLLRLMPRSWLSNWKTNERIFSLLLSVDRFVSFNIHRVTGNGSYLLEKVGCQSFD